VKTTTLKKVEDRISGLKDEIHTKEKIIRLLRLKSFERNMQELCYSIKRPVLRIRASKEEKRCKSKA
jgi:hypothetical protein